MSEIRTNVTISGETLEYRSNIEISIVTLNSKLEDTHSSFRTNIDISTELNDGTISSIKTTLELDNISLDFYLVDMTKLNQSLLYFSKFFNMYFEPEVMWELLAQGTNEQINISHLSDALSNYTTFNHLSVINESLSNVSKVLNEHINNNSRHLSEKEREFLEGLMNNPPYGSGDSLFELVGLKIEEDLYSWAVKPFEYEGNKVGIISDSYISCRGLDITAPSNGLTRNDLFTILSEEPLDDFEYIDERFIKAKDILATREWVYSQLAGSGSGVDVPPWIRDITLQQIQSWNLVASLFKLSDDETYVYTTNDRGFVSNSFISCKGIDDSSISSGSIIRNELFDILSGEPLEGEYINSDFIIGLDDIINGQGFLKEISYSQVINALGYTPLRKIDFLDFYAVSNIIQQDIDNWNFVFGLIDLSEDKTYIFPKESRGFVSLSFISCKGIDSSANQNSGITRSELFDILSNTPIDNSEYINLSFLDLSNYVTKVDLSNYTTIDYVNTAIQNAKDTRVDTLINTTIPALESDIAKRALQSDLTALQTSHNALRNDFDALNTLLNDDVSEKIDTWNEVVDFLDEYSGSQDLATILSVMNADIAKRALQTSLDTTNANLNNHIDTFNTFVDATNNTLLSHNNRIKTFEDIIGIDDNGDVYIKKKADDTARNFYSYGEVSSGGLSDTGGSTGGGSNVSYTQTYTGGLLLGTLSIDGVTDGNGIYAPNNLSAYNNDVGFITSSAIPTALKNPYALSWSGFSSGNYDGSGTANIAIPTTLPASDVYAWAKKPSLAVADVPDLSGKYLPLSGGTITGSLTVKNDSWTPIIFEREGTSAFIGSAVSLLQLGFGEGYLNIGVNELTYATSGNLYGIIHSGNIGSYSPIYNANGNVTIGSADLAGSFVKLFVDGFIGLSNGGSKRKVLGFENSNLYLGYESVSTFNTFITGNTASLNTLKGSLLLNENGNVLIGPTTDVWGKLQVYGNSVWVGRFATDKTQVAIANPDGAGLSIDSTVSNSGNALLNIRYGQSTLGSTGETALAVKDNGNVGIGTDSPAYKLDVAGTLNATTIYQNGTAIGSLAFKNSLVASDIPSLDWSKITTGKPTTLAGYGITDALSTSGGTINSGSFAPLTINGDGTYTGVGYSTSSGTAYFIRTAGGNWIVTDNGWNTNYTLIHSGNYTSYAIPSYDGIAAVYNPSMLTYSKVLGISNGNLYLGFSDVSTYNIEITGSNSVSLNTINGTKALNVINNGHVLIGTTLDYGYKLNVNGKIGAKDNIVILADAGYYQFSPDGTTLYSYIGHDKPNAYTWLYNGISGGSIILYDAGGINLTQSTTILSNLTVTADADFGGSVSINNSEWTRFGITRGGFGSSSIGGVDPSGVYFSHYLNGVESYMYLKAGTGLTVYSNLTATGEVTSGSDARYKLIESYAEIDIDTIANAPIINFKWTDREDDKLHLGSTAQYWYNTSLLNGVSPTDDEKLWTMGYGQIALASAVSVAKKVVNHEDRLQIVEKELADYKAENQILKQQLNQYRYAV